MGDGLDFKAASSASFTILFLLALSPSGASLGTMSSSSTSTPILAKWQAILLPITPDPSTATFFMARFIYLYLWLSFYLHIAAWVAVQVCLKGCHQQIV